MGLLLYTEYFIYIKLFMLETASSGRAVELLKMRNWRLRKVKQLLQSHTDGGSGGWCQAMPSESLRCPQ